MTTIFADAFYFFALLSPRDEDHARALAVGRDFKGRVVTTAWVLTEVADGMSLPKSRTTFSQFLADFRANPSARIVPPSEELFDAGLALYAARPDKDWPLTDCISF